MNFTTEPASTYSLPEAINLIAGKIKELSTGKTGLPYPVLRLELPVEKQDLLTWLAANDAKETFYFSGRDDEDMEMAGIGTADSVASGENAGCTGTFTHMRSNLTPAYPNLKYYGGISFAPGHLAEEWQSFGACRFIIPRFELLVKNSITRFACNLKIKESKPAAGEETAEQLQQLANMGDSFSPTPFPGPANLLSRTDLPAYDRWVTNLNHVIDEIKRGDYQKTVLARKVILQFANRLNPVALLAFLKALPSRRYDFLFRFDGKSAFVGSSPERLYKRSGLRLVSEALAGTRIRGQKEQDDLRLAKELMDSNKEQREHDFVIDTIEEELRPLCNSMEVDRQKSLMKLKEGQHLVTYIKALLKENIKDENLISTLHPTPAVGGCPSKEALKAIEENEPFKRGWYAGLVGTVGHDSSDLAVALRSALVHGSRLNLYSGVGIVEGSDPDDEWKELNSKIVNYMDMVENENNRGT